MLVIEAIPYESFKERIGIVKEYEGTGTIIILDGCVYIERIERDE